MGSPQKAKEPTTFYLVDVFAEEKFAGNQLAVVRDAHTLSEREMQRIAREMNFSETAFLLSDDMTHGGFDIRIFTPLKEVPFAGHPSLGSAYVIQREILREPVQKIVLNLKIGQIPVTLSYKEDHPDTLWMRQLPPVFGQIFDSDTIAGVLNIKSHDIDDRFPVQEVSTGLPFIIVPVRTLRAQRDIHINRDRLFELIEHAHAKAILAFCPQVYHRENHLNARVFAEALGVPEDPATGSANGCLGGYLVNYRYFGRDRIEVRVEQGHEIGRPSLIFLSAGENEGEIDIHVGGKVVMVAKGELV